MANTTVRGALSIHGTNPQFLIEKVIRSRIYESPFWKEHCFALTAESLIDKAIELNSIGGVYGNQKPTQFMCLLLKLLQIQPEKEILVEYLQAEEFKYLRALAAMYVRMTFRPVEVFQLLEPLLTDFRKLRDRSMAGYTLTFMDEFVYALLTEERVCDTILPRITKREVLEETEGLQPRVSLLLDAMEGSDSEDEEGRSRAKRKPPPRNRASESRSRSRTGSITPPPPPVSPRVSPSQPRSTSPSSPHHSHSRSQSKSPDQMGSVESSRPDAVSDLGYQAPSAE